MEARERGPAYGLPISKPCSDGCRQGMVLEVDPYDPTGGSLPDLPVRPAMRYRCQDCDREEELTDEYGNWI